MDTIYRLQDVIFTWDENKAQINRQKHGVSFQEAAEAFFDPFYQEGDASVREETRHFVLGYSISLRLLLVIYTDRLENPRLISARVASRAERKIYEDA